MTTATNLDTFTKAYVACALWSSTDLDGTPLDQDFNIDSISDEAMQKIIADCTQFQSENAELIDSNPEQAGHDFWLTRNRHGAGFWDGDWPKEVGEALTAVAHAFGEVDLYVGDDDKLYL